MRRIIFVVIVIAFYEWPIIQILGLILLQLVYMAVLVDLKPFAEPSEQKEEVMNEINCLLVLSFLVLFTGNIIEDPELRENIGLVLVATQVLFITAMIILLL